mmetsp:Transcript_21117/g.67310  ORF Transcript_21117/g.67310 Transcript_21117/m.67310 type:complete len:198 (-) Transcript_21117:1326-1919(-)
MQFLPLPCQCGKLKPMLMTWWLVKIPIGRWTNSFQVTKKCGRILKNWFVPKETFAVPKRISARLTSDWLASSYGRLEDVQGEAVPRLVSSGLFREGFLYGLTTSDGGVDGHAVDTFTPEMVEQAVAKLRLLHERGVLHGDVRRANVLYDEATGKVMLVDLAQAHMLDGDDELFHEEAEREVERLRACLQRQSDEDDE